MASFLMRESVELIGVETQSGEAVVWCGLHDIDWHARQCDTGYWVRKSAQGRGIATETANAMVRYAFGALGMQRVGLTHSTGNEPSRCIAVEKYCYALFDVTGLPDLDVTWGDDETPNYIGIRRDDRPTRITNRHYCFCSVSAQLRKSSFSQWRSSGCVRVHAHIPVARFMSVPTCSD